ncbi:uncharacterized protein GlcG (DUF336 family) [Sphingomonas zeicaulis]|uniref:GlcG/HbpS family heme-binding protein n=1 Tax=Sphingomonas zeicaulis TaxID=1632740 RepID=UPI003D252B21
MRRLQLTAAVTMAGLLLASCGGGGTASGGTPTPTPSPTPSPGRYQVPAAEALSVADVQGILARAVAEAQARNLPAVIAVVDRVGNVLAVYTMTGARPRATAQPAPNGQNLDVQNVNFPASMGAISKAITGAYLSSSGNAFTTRTASMIVKEHFPPGPNTAGLESGPLFGVQFSSLPCSDLVNRYSATAPAASAFIGPKRSPLGLSADPGGIPLYKNGVVVGAIGVMADGNYADDPDVTNIDEDGEEFVALAGSVGFEPSETIKANRITIDGTSLRFTDATAANFKSTPASAPPFSAINNSAIGRLTAVRGYYQVGAPDPVVLAGTPYGTEASGYRKATSAEFANSDAFILTDGNGNNRFPVRAGTDSAEVSQPLTLAESRAVLEEAFTIMSRARAQIRRPLDSRAQVTISLVDTRGQVLGVVRAPDAPVFGTDVSLQKARTAAFFSSRFAADELQQNTIPDIREFVPRLRTFLNDETALTGKVAFSDRAGGNLSRPFFPDGEVGRPNGPLSRPIENFNPFSTGLQSALIITNLAAHIFFVDGMNPADTREVCTFLPEFAPGRNRLQNGAQIFPGSMPIYRGNALIGAIGISGDGIDQDDMISFLGTHFGGLRVNGAIGNAPPEMRADRITVPVGNRQARLLYVQCPFAPFLDTSDQNACQDK